VIGRVKVTIWKKTMQLMFATYQNTAITFRIIL